MARSIIVLRPTVPPTKEGCQSPRGMATEPTWLCRVCCAFAGHCSPHGHTCTCTPIPRSCSGLNVCLAKPGSLLAFRHRAESCCREASYYPRLPLLTRHRGDAIPSLPMPAPGMMLRAFAGTPADANSRFRKARTATCSISVDPGNPSVDCGVQGQVGCSGTNCARTLTLGQRLLLDIRLALLPHANLGPDAI